jgi:hypothetical protein
LSLQQYLKKWLRWKSYLHTTNVPKFWQIQARRNSRRTLRINCSLRLEMIFVGGAQKIIIRRLSANNSRICRKKRWPIPEGFVRKLAALFDVCWTWEDANWPMRSWCELESGRNGILDLCGFCEVGIGFLFLYLCEYGGRFLKSD